MDCSASGAHQDLLTRFGVRGFPTMLFLKPDGEVVDRLGARDPASVRAKFEEIAAAHTRILFRPGEIAAAREQAVAGGKLLAVLFADNEEHIQAVTMVFYTEAFATFREQFIWVLRPTQGANRRPTDEARQYRSTRGPKLLFLDPWADAGSEEEVLGDTTDFRSPRGLTRELERVIETARERQRPLGQTTGETPENP